MGAVGAIGSLLGGAASLGSLFMSNNNSAQMQAQLAANAQQNAQNQQAYQQQLNAIALQRAIAGMTDATGNRIYYDPSTNEWKTVLSAKGTSIQNAVDNANISRNTTDYQRQLRANEGAERRALDVESASTPMLEAIKRYKPTDYREIEGNLQEAATLANRESFQPVIDSTLRQFARTGTAAGPVLASLAEKSATNLRRSMLENAIKSRTAAAEIDNSRRGGMIRDFATLNREATPQFGYSPISSDSPVSALTSMIAQRSNNAATPASYAAASVPGMTNSFNNATGMAIAATPNSNLLSAQLSGLGNWLSGNTNNMANAIQRLLQPGAGNAGDSQPTAYYNPNQGWNTPSMNTWQDYM